MTIELALIPIVPVIAALIIPIISLVTRNQYVYATVQLIASTIVTYFSLILFSKTMENQVLVYAFGGWPPPIGIAYVADSLNSLYGLIACSLALLISIYSFWYYRFVREPHWLSLLMLLLLSGVTGVIYTGDVFNFFVMLEVLALSSYALVSFFKRRKWAIEAAASYAFIGALATTFFLLGVSFIYLSYGTLNIADISWKANPQLTIRAEGVVNGYNQSNIMSRWSGECVGYKCYWDIRLASSLAVAFILWALTFEAGIFPNNYWLSSAYTEAPTPASAMFAGVVDKVGTYGVLRLFLTIFTPSSILMFSVANTPFRDIVIHALAILGLITGFLGAIIMAIQKDVKRLLSYSTMSHTGLIFIAMAGLTSNHYPDTASLILSAILFHSLTHAYGESLLFLGLGTLSTIAGSRRIEDLEGYGRIYLGLSIPITIGTLSLLGVAPLGGFFSKYLLFLALSKAGLLPYALSIIIITGISAIGYFRIIHALFFEIPRVIRKEKILVASTVCLVIALILVALGVLFATGYLYGVFEKIGCSVTTGVDEYIGSLNNVARILSGETK
ncbi:MAG: proton-conducting transporter membrane subunit [Desulfurococcaceae archaeon]